VQDLLKARYHITRQLEFLGASSSVSTRAQRDEALADLERIKAGIVPLLLECEKTWPLTWRGLPDCVKELVK
jgi:hypothetical protein